MSSAAAAGPSDRMSRPEVKWALGWATIVMAVTCIPYVIVWWYTPLGSVFPWTLFGADDHGVYYAWVRQAHDGEILFRNLFTTEPQRGVYFHAYFLLLGGVSRLSGLDVPLACHLGRVVCGIGALVLVYRLACFLSTDHFTRRCGFWVAAVASGFGWLFWTDVIRQTEPVDVWQPEALVPLSLYVNGLYAASLCLMLGFAICLLLSEAHGWRWALGAGLCLLVLGNIHSYDVIHLALVWGLYLACRAAIRPRLALREVGHAALAGATALPSVGYMAWLYLAEPVFRERADVVTHSGSPLTYLLGFGLLVPLAGLGVWVGTRPGADRRRLALPVAWVVGGVTAAYLPFAFQRKMVMGTEVPLALLAGAGIAWLSERAATSGPRRRLIAGVLVGLMFPSTFRFPARDVRMALQQNLVSTQAHPAYWPESDFQAFAWMGRHTPPNAALLTFPLNGVFAPALSGRAVWAGHFGETPHFADRVPDALRFYRGAWTSAQRRDFLRRQGITHVLWGPTEQVMAGPTAVRPLAAEPFLRLVFQAGETSLYAVAAAD